MIPKAEQGLRRRLEVISAAAGGGGGGIPWDVVPLILSYLPLNSLGRFKAVSRAWCELIQSLNLPPVFLGLFYTIFSQINVYPPPPPPSSSCEGIFRYIIGGGTKGGIDNNSSSAIIDPSLSFLPTSDHLVIDCCNGLLLICQTLYPKFTYYICNPLTKSSTQLCDLDRHFSLLDFDPKVSPNFKVITFTSPVYTRESVLRIRVLSSETSSMAWKQYAPVRFRDPSEDEHSYKMMFYYQHRALWEGSLYLLFGSGDTNFGYAGRIMRFDLFEDHVADRQFIELPKGTKKPNIVAIGRSRNKLCLAGLDWIDNNNNNNHPHHQMVPRLRVWSLSNRDQTIWAMEHDDIITSSHLLFPPAADGFAIPTYIGHFHPFLDVVFILSKNTVYAYNLKNLSLDEVCHIGFHKYQVIAASLFPFLPSMVDYTTQWKTEHRREASDCEDLRRVRRRTRVRRRMPTRLHR